MLFRILIIILPLWSVAQQRIPKYARFSNSGDIPGATIGFSETLITPNTISLDWRNVIGADSYIVQRSASRDYGSPAQIYSSTASTCIDTGLTSGTWYYYRVRSHNSNGNVGNWVNDSALTSSSAFDPDAQTFIDSAGISDGTQKAALHALVYGLKLDTLWDNLIVICPILGASYATAKWNLRYPINDDLAYRFVSIGSPTYDAAGMTPSTNNIINTKFIPAAAGLDLTTGMHMSYYSATSSSPNSYIMGIFQYAYIAPSPDGNSYVRMGASHSSGAGQNSSGFHLVNRAPSSGNQRYLHNGTVIIDAAKAFDQFNISTSAEIYVGGLNDAPVIYTTVQCGFYTIGKGLTPSQESHLRTRITTFLTAIGR